MKNTSAQVATAGPGFVSALADVRHHRGFCRNAKLRNRGIIAALVGFMIRRRRQEFLLLLFYRQQLSLAVQVNSKAACAVSGGEGRGVVVV